MSGSRNDKMTVEETGILSHRQSSKCYSGDQYGVFTHIPIPSPLQDPTRAPTILNIQSFLDPKEPSLHPEIVCHFYFTDRVCHFYFIFKGCTCINLYAGLFNCRRCKSLFLCTLSVERFQLPLFVDSISSNTHDLQSPLSYSKQVHEADYCLISQKHKEQ